MVLEGVSMRGQSHSRPWLLEVVAVVGHGCGTVWLWESVTGRGLAVECVLKRGVVMGCGPG